MTPKYLRMLRERWAALTWASSRNRGTPFLRLFSSCIASSAWVSQGGVAVPESCWSAARNTGITSTQNRMRSNSLAPRRMLSTAASKGSTALRSAGSNEARGIRAAANQDSFTPASEVKCCHDASEKST